MSGGMSQKRRREGGAVATDGGTGGSVVSIEEALAVIDGEGLPVGGIREGNRGGVRKGKGKSCSKCEGGEGEETSGSSDDSNWMERVRKARAEKSWEIDWSKYGNESSDDSSAGSSKGESDWEMRVPTGSDESDNSEDRQKEIDRLFQQVVLTTRLESRGAQV